MRDLHRAGNETLKILVADDDELILALCVDALIQLPDAVVMTARDGLEALACLSEWKPDVLIVDLRMPLIDGFKVLRIARSNAEATPATIVVSGLRDHDIEYAGGLPDGVIRIHKRSLTRDLLQDAVTQVRADSLRLAEI